MSFTSHSFTATDEGLDSVTHPVNGMIWKRPSITHMMNLSMFYKNNLSEVLVWKSCRTAAVKSTHAKNGYPQRTCNRLQPPLREMGFLAHRDQYTHQNSQQTLLTLSLLCFGCNERSQCTMGNKHASDKCLGWWCEKFDHLENNLTFILFINSWSIYV